MVVDCRDDEQFVAYGNTGQPTTMSKSSAQYVMSVSSSLPAVTSQDRHPSDGSCDPIAVHHTSESSCDSITVHHTSERSCDPITVLSDEEMDVHSSSDHVMSGENSSDRVMSGDSGDPTTTQRIKRKRRKLISSNKDLVSHWQPRPITVEEDIAVITNSTTASTIDDISPITVEEHNPISSHDPSTAKGRGSPTTGNTCDLTTVEGCDLPTALELHDNNKHRVGMVTNDNRGVMKSLWNNTQSYTRPSLTSVKSTKSFYNQSSNRPLYDFAPFTSSKYL